MKKIGILTLYHNNRNFGGLLQSYALCEFLIDQGLEAEQIAYLLESGYPKYKGKLITKIKHEIKLMINYGIDYRYVFKKNKKIRKFELSIPHTKETVAREIGKLNDRFDIFICGSDQIWNPIGWQDTLFLSFVKDDKKKIAYAASIARDEMTKDEATYALNHIKSFSKVSLREKESIFALKKYDELFEVDIMPDPTLLLTKQQWEKVIGCRIENKPYIFAYFLGNNLKQRDRAIEYAKHRNIKIFFVKYLDILCRKWENEHDEYMLNDVGVNEFLSLIKNAELVITDSFHAAVFSAIFQTPFEVLNRFEKSDKKSMNSRIKTLMNILKINRSIEDLDFDKDYSFSEDELLNINEQLAKQREKGKEFLMEAIGIR